jgi:hypothetical protein
MRCLRHNAGGVHRFKAALRHGEPVTLISVARLLVGGLTVPRVCKHFWSHLQGGRSRLRGGWRER